MDSPQALSPQPELAFQSPSLLEEFHPVGIAMLVLFLLVLLIVGGVAAFVTGSPWVIFAYGVIILIGAACVAAVLLLRRGKVVLDADGLVEYNALNASRRFTYDQIFKFQNGAYANSLVIHYYPRLGNGAIDTLHPHRANLISVRDPVGLKMALARRITPSKIDSTAGKDRLPLFIFLMMILVVFPILLLLWLNLQ